MMQLKKYYNQLADLLKRFTIWYSIEPDGAMSDSQTAMEHLLKPIPVMVIAVITILMFQIEKCTVNDNDCTYSSAWLNWC